MKAMAVFRSNLLLVIASVLAANNVDCIDVNIQGVGIMRGSTANLNGKGVDTFRGIPFAKVPTGERRFKPPEKADPWNGIRNSINSTIYCPQRTMETRTIAGQEDCLYLNIYKPNDTAGAKLPVMVWIHGGAYIAGSAFSYNGAMLSATREVIVVTINYRLGVLGFLNIPGTNVSGNYGLMDQILALKWVSNHIGDFGGDRSQVTIFGESAGSGSVTLLMLSPLAKGLFKRVIAQSGAPLNFWAVQRNQDLIYAVSFGNSLGCNDPRQMADCLRGKTWKQIIEKQVNLPDSHPVVTPVVDGKVVAEYPYDQVEKGTLPSSSVELLLGFNKDEGSMFIPNIKVWNELAFRIGVKLRTRWVYGKNTDLVTDLVGYEYPRWTVDSDYFKYLLGFNDFLNEYEFKVGIINFAAAWAKKGIKTYLYHFTYMPQQPRVPALGVAHAIELGFVFGRALYPVGHPERTSGPLVANFTKEDANVSESMMKMWTDFAKTGNPSNSWPVYNDSTKQYLEINKMNSVKANIIPKRMAFWNKLVPKMVAMANTRPVCPTTGPNIVTTKKRNVDSGTTQINAAIALYLTCFFACLPLLL